ncbi:Transmembrane protein [Phytophthora megakarya]|uniref:Transmembrane protein n=1 Tax=Phytophthora megakarya TaxID=4795 RepID=A0A225W0L7_9STRA|nr:Transmembrane protein [Phytophthora megakarya]
MVRRNLFSIGSSNESDRDSSAKPVRGRTVNNRRAPNNRRPLEAPLPPRKRQPQRSGQDMDDSYATTAPAVSTRRDPNIFDIPIISTRRQDALDSTCAVVDYDGAVSSKAMRHGDGGISINANSSVPSDDYAIQKGSVEFVSCRHIGLLVSTLFAGVLNTCLKRGMLPLLQAELELETYQADAANVLMLLPWSYTFVWGFISDAFPMLGSRRKSYIIAGWVVSLVTCFAMAILNYTLEYNALSSRAATEEALQHRVALIDGYIGLLMLASFGGVLTLIISETYIVAQTRREPLEMRGTAIGTLLLTQFMGELVGQIASDKAIFNITEFGLTPIVTFRQTALFFMFYSLVPLFALVFFFYEDPDPPEIDDGDNNYGADESHIFIQEETATSSCFMQLRPNWLRLRRALAKESTIRVIRFFMIFVFLSEFTLTYPHAQLEIWCNFTDKAQSSSNITQEAFYVLAAAAWKFCALNWNWRHNIAGSLLIIMILPQVIFFYIATWAPGMRNQEAFSFMTALRGFMRSAVVVLEVVLSAEIAPVGGEGAFVGIIVSMSSIMRLLSTTSSNVLGFMFEDPTMYRTDQQGDQVAFGLGICYSIRIISIVALIYLPRQKQEIQRLHRFGAQGDKSTTWWVLGSLGSAFFISAIFNLLAIIPSTSCLQIVGGSGCS